MKPTLSRGSIRRRLLLSLLASAAVLAVAVYFVVMSVASQVAQQSQDSVLDASARSILDSARFVGGQISLDFPYSALSMLDGVVNERVFYAIRLEDEFLSGYADLPLPDGGRAAELGFFSAAFLGEEVRIASVQRFVATDVGQRLLQVSVAQTRMGQKQALAWISRTSMGIGFGFFLSSVLLAILVARSTIRPLDRLTVSVSRRGPKDLRPVAAPVPKEMVPLVTSLNSLMKRLKKSLTRSEDFIAEAAHRVRTPLAIVRTKAEIARHRTQDAATIAALSEMIHAIDDSSRTAGQLLDHAMVTFRLDDLAKHEVDLAQLVADTVERQRPVSELKAIRLAAPVLESFRLKGDPILLQNALLNVLDNAIKYSPEGTQVEVCVKADTEAAVLTVCDTGPGFPEDEIDTLTGRFTRGGNAGDVIGSGLGLTIAKEVLDAHGGSLRISNIAGVGGCVTFFFPSS
ncbi:MAG: sensor histidine kinase [Epibacterium sp.]|jgi:two-component system sensor histidine kinase TctE|nr:sensor histidine kinase [Epibacterium sp.]NQX72617.1 sensor histidine kinase [Epibacterium sp.]